MRKKKILIIEDEEDMLFAMTLQLQASNYEIITTKDGQEGLDKARKKKPDLIILDLMLPKMDGYKVCGMLKSDKKYMRIPIIMFTARASEVDKQLGRDVRADAYIVKPFDPRILLNKVSELLNHGPAYHEKPF